MTISAEELQKGLNGWLDKILATGEPLHIERHGQRLTITPDKFTNVPKRACIVGDPDDLVHMDWSSYRSHDLP